MNKGNLPEGHNFTNISDIELLLRGEAKNRLGPLLFWRVLKTRELMTKIGYKYEIKSFRKILARYKRLGLIESASEDRFSSQYLFPGENLLKELRGNEWPKFSLLDTSLSTVKDHHHLVKLIDALSKLESVKRLHSYINQDDPDFDFKLEFFNGHHFEIAFYTFPTGSEKIVFQRISSAIKKGKVSAAIIVSSQVDKKFRNDILEYYMPDDWKVRARIGWCSFAEEKVEQTNLANISVSIFGIKQPLNHFVDSGIFELNQKIQKTEHRINNPTLWDKLKEAFE